MKTAADFIAALRPVSHDPKTAQHARRLAARADAAQTVDRLEALADRQQRQRWRSLATLCRLRRALHKVAKCGTLAAPFVALLMLGGCVVVVPADPGPALRDLAQRMGLERYSSTVAGSSATAWANLGHDLALASKTYEPLPALPSAPPPRTYADFVALGHDHGASLRLAELAGDPVARRVRLLESNIAANEQENALLAADAKPSGQLHGLVMSGLVPPQE